MEKGASGAEPLQHGLVGCFMFVLQKSVENRNVGPPNSHTDDPELHELRRSYLESSVHEYDVKARGGGGVKVDFQVHIFDQSCCNYM